MFIETVLVIQVSFIIYLRLKVHFICCIWFWYTHFCYGNSHSVVEYDLTNKILVVCWVVIRMFYFLKNILYKQPKFFKRFCWQQSRLRNVCFSSFLISLSDNASTMMYRACANTKRNAYISGISNDMINSNTPTEESSTIKIIAAR